MNGLYLIAIAAYIAILWMTGILVTRKSRSSDAYLVASRGLSVPFIAVLIAGTWIGGVSIVGMAQGSFIHGLSALWFQAGIWIAMFVTAMLLTRVLGGKKTYSILDVVGGLYDRKTTRLAGILQLIFSIWIVTMQIVGGGAILPCSRRALFPIIRAWCLPLWYLPSITPRLRPSFSRCIMSWAGLSRQRIPT